MAEKSTDRLPTEWRPHNGDGRFVVPQSATQKNLVTVTQKGKKEDEASLLEFI